jgi:hypothetical protein
VNFEERIRHDWQGNDALASVCLCLVQALRMHPRFDHYTFNQLREWARTENLESLARALFYLSSPPVGMLRASVMYEDEGTLLELPREELLHYERGEDVVHPKSGEKLPRAELFVAFEPGEVLRTESPGR